MRQSMIQDVTIDGEAIHSTATCTTWPMTAARSPRTPCGGPTGITATARRKRPASPRPGAVDGRGPVECSPVSQFPDCNWLRAALQLRSRGGAPLKLTR